MKDGFRALLSLHSFVQMSIGSRVTAYQLQVDTQPPAVQGASMVWINQLPANMDPNAAANIPGSYTAQLVIWLNFTKPILGLSKVREAFPHGLLQQSIFIPNKPTSDMLLLPRPP